MNIAVGSAFRNSAGRLPGYFKQIQELQRFSRDTIRVIAAEGDSTDGTREALFTAAKKYDVSVDVRACDHKGPVFGSTEAPERMAALSKVGNTILDGVRDADEVLVYVESDLIWDAITIWLLCQHAYERTGDFNVFAPMPFAGQNFYDVWAFRGLDGQRFAPFSPYHSQLAPKKLMEVSSVGSCLVMRTDVVRSGARMKTGALVEFCAEVRKRGFRIAVVPELRVKHPA